MEFFKVLIGIIAVFLVYKFVIRFFIDYSRMKKAAYSVVSPQVKYLIDNKEYEQLGRLTVQLTVEGRYEEGEILMKAIDSKGISFSRKVDKYTNKFRKEAGLPPLKSM